MRIWPALFIVFSCLLTSLTWAQDELKITDLSPVDREFMEQQRSLLRDMAAIKLGRSFSGKSAADIALLQTLLDRRLVRPEQTRELQAMGIILGDLLAAELDMHWVIYEDDLGRSRALRYRESDNYLFPVTMISRRQQAGSTTTVEHIYRKAYDIIDAVRTPLPFQ